MRELRVMYEGKEGGKKRQKEAMAQRRRRKERLKDDLVQLTTLSSLKSHIPPITPPSSFPSIFPPHFNSPSIHIISLIDLLPSSSSFSSIFVISFPPLVLLPLLPFSSFTFSIRRISGWEKTRFLLLLVRDYRIFT